MKRLLLPALIGALAANSQAVIIWDNHTGVSGATASTSTPRFLMADSLTTIADAGAGMQWQINSVDFGLAVSGVQSWAAGRLTVKMSFYNNYNPAATGTTPVFSNLAGTYTHAMGGITTTATGTTSFAITGSQAANPFKLAAKSTNFGVTFEFFLDGTRTDLAQIAWRDIAPTVGTSHNGFFRDMNDDGIIAANEASNFANWTNGNARMRVNATAVPVPEPASMAALALGAGIVARRRRRNS